MSFDPAARPRSIVVPGTGTQTLSFTLPEGVVLRLESIVAAINAAGATSTPELTITAPGGAVIADKSQGDSIPAGDTGRATWALRLADRGGGGGVEATYGANVRRAASQSIPDNTFTQISWNVVLWDTAGMTTGASFIELDINEDGLYLCRADVQFITSAGDDYPILAILSDQLNVATSNGQHGGWARDTGVPALITIIPVVALMMLQAGNGVRLRVRHNAGANRSVIPNLTVVRIGTFA